MGIASAETVFDEGFSAPRKYDSEEVRSCLTYPMKYKGPKPIEIQVKMLASIFGLDASHALEFAKNLSPLQSFVPVNALKWTGWFAIPLVNALAKKYFPEVTDSARKYYHAIQLVLDKIANTRSLYVYREGRTTSEHFRNHTRTAYALDRIAEMQGGDILIVAAQLGMCHRGRSVRRAREVFAPNEFGLGSLAVGSIVLTHPERLVRWRELDMDCAGDDFAPYADDDFYKVPGFHVSGITAKFGMGFIGDPRDRFGSVTGFLPYFISLTGDK